MDKTKRFIKILIVVILIIIVLIVLLLNYNKNKNSIHDTGNQEVSTDENSEVKPYRTNTENTFYTVDETIKTYLSGIKIKNGDVLISYLNEEYIKKNSITKNNIFNIINTNKNYDSYRTIEMYEINNLNSSSYYIKGMLDGENVFYEVNMDTNNRTFDIMPITEQEYNTLISTTLYTQTMKDKVIEKKEYNFYRNKYFEKKDIVEKYFSEYLNTIHADIKEAYNLLDEEYKTAKFGTENEFRNYVKENEERLKRAYQLENIDKIQFGGFSKKEEFRRNNQKYGIEKYIEKKYDEYTQYICVDGYNNYYIYNVTLPGEYKVLLDTYTTNTKQFIEKYDNGTEQTKVGMNIEKIISALNAGDYKYIYGKMDETFRNNTYGSIEKFKAHMSQALFKSNEIEYGEYNKEGNVHIYKVKISDKDIKSKGSKNLTIIMQLLENRNFVMSFSIE